MMETKLQLEVLMMEMKRFKAFVLSAAEKAGLSELQTSISINIKRFIYEEIFSDDLRDTDNLHDSCGAKHVQWLNKLGSDSQ